MSGAAFLFKPRLSPIETWPRDATESYVEKCGRITTKSVFSK